MTATAFALDANVFIEAHRRYYGLDLCPGFWNCLGYHGERQRLLSIDRIRGELLQGGDALSRWVKKSPSALFVSSAEPDVVGAFREVMDWVARNTQFRPEAKAEFAAAADGWLAAYARVHGAVLITHETVHSGREAARALGQRLSPIRRTYEGYVLDAARARGPFRLGRSLRNTRPEFARVALSRDGDELRGRPGRDRTRPEIGIPADGEEHERQG